ncbi:hypothetical protein [Actinoplanes sp. NPDC049681]|uniref:hypothetical protein n=1 Tax=Actinoplanes sp. NPDC049681 TaxID=3363905 RepID=UPI00378E75E1
MRLQHRAGVVFALEEVGYLGAVGAASAAADLPAGEPETVDARMAGPRVPPKSPPSVSISGK